MTLVAGRVIQTDAEIAFGSAVKTLLDFSHGVSKSLREIRQKSLIKGAPNTAAPEHAAVMPGTTSISISG